MKDQICLYAAFAKVAFLTQMEYRGQYVMRLCSKVIGWSTGFLMILILLERFKKIGTWSTYEILLLYSFEVLSYSIAGTFFMKAFGKLPLLIRQGELDTILTKPLNPMVYLICTRISAGYTSNYVIACVIMIICFQKLQIRMSLSTLIWLAADLVGATLIQASGFIFTAVPSFWLLNSEGLYWLFFKNLTDFLQYPLSVYQKGIQILLTFVLPYAFINYYPVSYFINKQEELLFPWFCFLTPAIGGVIFFLAYQFWNIGLKAYQSSGS